MKNKISKLIPFFITCFLFLISTRTVFAQSSADLELQVITLSVSENYYQYRIQVLNKGPDTAENILVSSISPTGVNVFVTHLIKNTTSECNSLDNTISCNFARLSNGESLFIDVVANVIDKNISTAINKISVNSSVDDQALENNSYDLTVDLPRTISASDNEKVINKNIKENHKKSPRKHWNLIFRTKKLDF